MTVATTPAYRAYALLVFTMMCWGANAVVGKLAVGHVSPLLLTNLRWGLAGLIVLPFAWPHIRRDWPVIRRHAPLLVAYGGIGFACFNGAFYSALNYTSAINVVIEQAGMPGVIFALNFLLLRQLTAGRQLLGFVMTVAGVAIVVSNGEPGRLLGLDLNRGDALMLLAILCYGGYTAALRIKPPMHWLSFISTICGAAFVCSLPFTAWELTSGNLIVPDLQGWAAALFTALLPGLLAQTSFIRSNELIGSNRAGIFINLVPIFGTLFSIVFVGERVHLYHAIALVLVIGGIGLAERTKALC